LETISAANLNGGKAWAYIMMSHTRRAKERVRGRGGAQHFFGAVVKQTQAYPHLFHAAGTCIKAFVLVLVTSQKCVPETFVFPKKTHSQPPRRKDSTGLLESFRTKSRILVHSGSENALFGGLFILTLQPVSTKRSNDLSRYLYDKLLTAVTRRVRRT